MPKPKHRRSRRPSGWPASRWHRCGSPSACCAASGRPPWPRRWTTSASSSPPASSPRTPRRRSRPSSHAAAGAESPSLSWTSATAATMLETARAWQRLCRMHMPLSDNNVSMAPAKKAPSGTGRIKRRRDSVATSRLVLKVVSAAALTFGMAASVQSAEIELPRTIAWSAYDVGSAGYNQAVAIGNALKNAYGINLRVLPGKNDISRNLVLREGKVQFSATGVGGAYLAQEGVFEFGVRSWGPQPIRALLLNKADQSLSVAAAGDVGIKTIADLKGKRVAWVIGSPSLNQNITALLAFAGLTWDDVEKVEFGGYGASWEGILNNQADVAFTSSVAGHLYKLAASPRGLVHPIVPHDDEEGWKRLRAHAPFFVPVMATEGADMSKDKPVETAAYPYPILIAYADQKDDMVYNMTKAMVEAFDAYKDGAPG